MPDTRVHSAWFHIYEILEKAKYRKKKQNKTEQLPGFGRYGRVEYKVTVWGSFVGNRAVLHDTAILDKWLAFIKTYRTVQHRASYTVCKLKIRKQLDIEIDQDRIQTVTNESNQITKVRLNLFFHGEKGSSLSNFGKQSFKTTKAKMNNAKEKITIHRHCTLFDNSLLAEVQVSNYVTTLNVY